MKILGIESSCDETAAAVVENGVKVLSCKIYSQVEMHAKTGGVVPEVAAREHVLKIVPVVKEALEEAGVNMEQIDAIAVTRGPGLLSSLIVGFSLAQTLAWLFEKPLIPVNHVAGHIYSNWLESTLTPSPSPAERERGDEIELPAMILTVSGGHNELVLMKEQMSFELIGETLDDAAGEAFDKVARLLGLGYPGGPAISKKAVNGNENAFNFPRAMLNSKDFNFSFSGLKTAALNLIEEEKRRSGELSEEFKSNAAASFEQCIAEILTTKLLAAAKKYNVKEIHLAGGVSANIRLRKMIAEKAAPTGLVFRYNQNLTYCTDNAAMIAAAAFYYFQKNPKEYNNRANSKLPDPNLNLYLENK